VVVEYLNESMKSVTITVNETNIEMVDSKCKSGRDVETCTAVPEIQTAYRTTITVRQGTMFVSKTREAPELIEKALHCWTSEVSYSILTHEEV